MAVVLSHGVVDGRTKPSARTSGFYAVSVPMSSMHRSQADYNRASNSVFLVMNSSSLRIALLRRSASLSIMTKMSASAAMALSDRCGAVEDGDVANGAVGTY